MSGLQQLQSDDVLRFLSQDKQRGCALVYICDPAVTDLRGSQARDSPVTAPDSPSPTAG